MARYKDIEEEDKKPEQTEPEQPPEKAPEPSNKKEGEEEEEEDSFAGHLSDLGKALSSKQEAESTLESLATIAKAAEKWIKIRSKIQNDKKIQQGKETQDENGEDISERGNIAYDNITNKRGTLYNKDSDYGSFVESSQSVLDETDPVQAVLKRNGSVNMNSLKSQIEGYKTFTQNTNKFQEAIKASGNKTQDPITQAVPTSKPGEFNQQQSIATSLQQQETKSTQTTDPVKDPTKVNEVTTEPENVEVPEAEINTQAIPETEATTPELEDTSVEQIDVATVEGVDEIADAGGVSNQISDILDKNKGLSSLFGKAT
tara:strand:- start:120 stop:1067 length:948 start_codon:yes stop_codon:yes gene_type:complete